MPDLPPTPAAHATALPPLPALRYAEVRRRWFWAALMELLRKWAIYIVMGLAILGAFSAEGSATSMAAVMAWTVAPLFRATQWPWWWALGCALAHGLIGVGVVLALRRVLWSGPWLEAEHALPITRPEMKASDAMLVLLCLLPLFGTYAAAGMTWTVQAPAWLRGSASVAWGWLGVSMATSVAAGMLSIGHLRQPLRSAAPADATASDNAPAHRMARTAAPLAPRQPWQTLAAWPIWRGPARGLGLALAGFTLGTVAALASITLAATHSATVDTLVGGTHMAAWMLAGLGLWTLVGTARLHRLHGMQLQPLHDAALAVLPLRAKALQALRLAVIGLPAGLALIALPLVWAAGALPVRPAVALVYWLGLAACHAWHATLAPHDAQSQVSRWLGALIVLTALASEVYP
jgi:hypothetical protein